MVNPNVPLVVKSQEEHLAEWQLLIFPLPALLAQLIKQLWLCKTT